MICQCCRSNRSLLLLSFSVIVGISHAFPASLPAQLVWKPPKLPVSSKPAEESGPSAQPFAAQPDGGGSGASGKTAILTSARQSSTNRGVRPASLAEPDSDSLIIEKAPELIIEKKPEGPEVIPTPEALSPEELPKQPYMFAPQIGDQMPPPEELLSEEGPIARPMPPFGACEPYSPCGPCGAYSGESELFRDGLGVCLINALSGFSFFAGIHGFKGPVDLGQNGNFGFHEGLNFGGPLGDPWGFGYQLGAQTVHSDLTGFRVDPSNGGPLDTNGRDQIFFTGGLFRRAICGGFQGGVVFDYVHDSYYDKADLQQIRSETAFVSPNRMWEIGYWGAYGLNRERFVIPTRPNEFVLLQPNDIFAVFYRRHFSGGGQGRLWAGATGAGQGIIGGEATVPLGTSWALENNFVYVIPKTSAANGGQAEEHWSVSINLVWYPGRAARSVFKDPFHPLFGVGDNSALLIRR